MRVQFHPASHGSTGNAPADDDCGNGQDIGSRNSNQRRRVRFLNPVLPDSLHDHEAQTLVKSEAGSRREVCNIPELSYQLSSGLFVTTTFCSDACRSLRNQCAESNTHGREVGGLLVGYHREISRLFRQQCQLMITDVIPIESIDSSSSHVCFGHNAWLYVERELEATYLPKGKCRLGWYHTHPSQGIFFSSQDREAHSIFKKPFELALVVDPRTMEAGLFYWRDRRDKVLVGPICFTLPV